MSSPEAVSPAAVRRCQSCTACCIHLPIPAGIVGPDDKPPGAPCPHVDGCGCRVYARRPHVCDEFACAWLKSPDWPEAWRPDRSGLMCLCEELDPGLFASAVYEVRPGALRKPLALQIIERLRESTAAVVLIDHSRQRRRCLLGRPRGAAPHRAMPAPHFLMPATQPVGPACRAGPQTGNDGRRR